MDLTLKAREPGLGYWVYSGDSIAGVVVQVEGWSVRGRPKHWVAYRRGKPIGRARTRKDAVDLLSRFIQKLAA